MNKMNKWIACVGAAVALVSLVSAGSLADSKKGTPCPVCKMPLSSTKTKDNPTAVRLSKGAKVQYCCAKCKMPASVLVSTKSSGKMAPKKGGKMAPKKGAKM
jgi:hypothetical protein